MLESTGFAAHLEANSLSWKALEEMPMHTDDL